MLHDTLARSMWRIWLDVGNERDWRKVLLGTTTTAQQVHSSSCFSISAALRVQALLSSAPPATARRPPTPGEEKRQKSRGSINSSQRSGTQLQAAVATLTRLEIAPRTPPPEILPLMLAGVRAALFQVLFQEALTSYQALLAQQPAEQRDHVVLAVEPERLGAAAQLLLDAPTLNAAVSLLALGAFHKFSGNTSVT